MTKSHHGFSPAATAVRYLQAGDRDGPAWVFHHCMDAADRAAFDEALVLTDHPLAHRAGSCEARFRAYVDELANATREGKSP